MEKGISIRIGTSGWMYNHWQKIFYPDKLPKSKWLEYYAGQFDTVELNASFYRLPTPATFKGWKERTPDNFLWSVKASKFITHIRRLKDPAEPLGRLYNSIIGLGEKLGVILFQLPPSLSFDERVFRDFSGSLDPNLRYALEIRHPSWINDPVFAILSEFNMALCISDTAGRYPSSETITADFVYIRLHGSGRLYASEYSEKELQAWAEKVTAWNRDSFIYFDNDFEGHAIKNAGRLKEILVLQEKSISNLFIR
jgi:uncharacterized protein YecE (DUF72 family)